MSLWQSVQLSPLMLYAMLKDAWLCPNILSNEVCIINYSLVRLDRNKHEDGVAMYIGKTITYNVLLSGSTSLEFLSITLFRNTFGLCQSVFYRPPSYTTSIFDTRCEALFSLKQSYFSNLVVLGDFNVNFADSGYHNNLTLLTFCQPFHFIKL